jgi:acylphosphatase
MRMRRGHFIITGRVQGVCYRMCACVEAQRFGVTGWVRNLDSGDVEIVAEGSADALAGFLRWCRRGPAHAVVRGVREEYAPATGEFLVFDILY